MPEITLVLGVDAKTLPQFEVSHRTWKLHQPKLWSWPWVVFFDGTIETMPMMLATLQEREAFPRHAHFVAWPHCLGGNSRNPKYEHQRERMLSGFPYVAAEFVQTPWWCKLDTDAICHRASDWPRDEWFAPDEFGIAPVTVAPSWHYSKGLGALDRLQEWGDTAGPLAAYPRPELPSLPNQMRVPHKRWCSWNSFYCAEWTRAFVRLLAESGLEQGKLPIPSQDGAMWYAAERAGLRVQLVNMKKWHWSNHPKLPALIEAAQSVMRGDAQEAMADG